MRLRFVMMMMMMMLAITTPLSAQSGAGTYTCNVGAGFECQLYVLRNGRDSAERRVAKVIAVWRGALAMHNGAVDTATARANAAEYRRRSRQAEDIGRTFMGGASGSGFHELTLSRRRPQPGRGWGDLDSAFVGEQGFRIPAGDTALVLMMSGPFGVDRPIPTITTTLSEGLLPPSGERRWQNGDTTFFVRPPRNTPNLPSGFTELTAVKALAAPR